MYVISDKKDGRAMYVNDEDHRYLLLHSRAHALRFIKWLGLNEVLVRLASDEEEANGYIDTVCASPHR